jgi:F-type H+-transporting ATPase subunit epsilon
VADSLRLRVYTPEQELFDGEVREVTAPGAYGEIGILPDHAALVTTLEPGVLSYKQDGRVGRYQIKGGFAEVRDNVVTVLADSGEPVSA